MIRTRRSILNIHFDPGSGSQAHEYPWPEADTKGQIPCLEFPGRREWSAIDCLRTLYSRKVTLLCAIGACSLAATLLSLAQPRLYRSEASLEIQGVNEDFLNARDIYPTVASTSDSAGTYIQTQAEALQQDALIEQVVKKLRLEEQPEFERGLSVWQRFRSARRFRPGISIELAERCRDREEEPKRCVVSNEPHHSDHLRLA